MINENIEIQCIHTIKHRIVLKTTLNNLLFDLILKGSVFDFMRQFYDNSRLW